MIFWATLNFVSSNFNNMGKTNQIYRGREIAFGTLQKSTLLRKNEMWQCDGVGVGVCE